MKKNGVIDVKIYLVVVIIAILVTVSIFFLLYKQDHLINDDNVNSNISDVDNKNTIINDVVNDSIVDNSNVGEDSFKSCSSGKVWGCRSITQGEYAGEPAPSVCGCIPECSSGLHLVTSGAGVNDVWPDESKKGLFECSRELPP